MTRKGFEQIVRAAGAVTGMIRYDDHPGLAPTSIAISLDPLGLGALEVWIADQPAPKRSRQEVGGRRDPGRLWRRAGRSCALYVGLSAFRYRAFLRRLISSMAASAVTDCGLLP
jgi:hypothetical protein